MVVDWNCDVGMYRCELMISEIKHDVYRSTCEMYMVHSYYVYVCIGTFPKSVWTGLERDDT